MMPPPPNLTGGASGPATSGNQAINPSTGAQTFNFNAPSAGVFGGGQTGSIVKGVVAVVVVLSLVAVAAVAVKARKK